MSATFLGTLVFLSAFALIGIGLLLIIVGRMQRQTFLPRLGRRIALVAVLGYASTWVVGVLATPKRVLAVGQEVSFCGLDCHLHVSVVRSTWDPELAVVLRFRSNAKGALEYPSLLRIEARDDSGRAYLPVSGLVAEPLSAGQELERLFRFNLPRGTSRARVVVSQDGWLDLLIPGPANPVAQRKTELAL